MRSNQASAFRSQQFDYDDRQSEMSKPQRLPPLEPSEFDPDAIAFAAKISGDFANQPGANQSGKISDTFRTQFRHFPLFRASMGLYTFLLTQGDLPDRDRELIIMRVLWLCGSPNPYAPHVDIARKLGMDDDEIRRVQIGSNAPGWSEHDRYVLRGVEELYERQALSDETWEILKRTWSDRQIMEFPALVGTYFMSAIVHNTMRTTMGDGNNGFRQID